MLTLFAAPSKGQSDVAQEPFNMRPISRASRPFVLSPLKVRLGEFRPSNQLGGGSIEFEPLASGGRAGYSCL
jgi:hypothetical protein